MAKTNFKKLIGQIQAIAPMCNFEMPEALCTDKELYFRFHYSWMDEAITALDFSINLIPGIHASKA